MVFWIFYLFIFVYLLTPVKMKSDIFNIVMLFYYLSRKEVEGTQFVSHVRVTTPAHSYAHGVGDPLPVLERRSLQSNSRQPPIRDLRTPLVTQAQYSGYPRQKPLIPFNADEPTRTKISPWQHILLNAETIPVLPPSPYKVDSPDPESLWPVGLFLPPLKPPGFDIKRRSNTDDYMNPGFNEESSYNDPYILQGTEALAAVEKARRHGELYFHDIPHITSLLANQELRLKNNLRPHRIGSIRQSWLSNRV